MYTYLIFNMPSILIKYSAFINSAKLIMFKLILIKSDKDYKIAWFCFVCYYIETTADDRNNV